MKLRHLILASVAFLGLAACEKEPEGGKTPTTYDHPFTTVSFTVGDETVEGVIGTDKTITAAFNNTDDFSNVKVVIKTNPGFKITTPANLEAADFSEENVLIFEDSKGLKIKYFINFTSNAYPLYSTEKVTVDELEAGENLNLDKNAKTITIAFTKAMDAESITLAFDEDALVAGFVPQDDLDFDFTTSLEQTVAFTKAVEGAEAIVVEYKVVLDMSAVVLMTPTQMGFQDITANYVDATAYPYIKVYRTEGVSAVPVDVLPSSQVLKDSFGGWYKDTPNMWEADAAWAWNKVYEFTDDAFNLYGDWEAERWGISEIVPIVMVVIDANAVKGGIETNGDAGVDITTLTNLVSVTGTPNFDALHLLDNGEYVRNLKSSKGDGWKENDMSYRAAVGFDADGKMSFATMYTEGNVVQQIDFIKAGGDVPGTVAAAYDWNVVDAATNFPYLYRDGYAVKKMDQILNDGSTYSVWDVDPSANWGDDPADALGHGTKGYGSSRAIIGRTWDGKITIAVCPNGWEEGATGDATSPYYGRHYQPHGYSLNQLTYLMVQLGWRDVFPLGSGAEWSADDSSQAYRANIRINGTLALSEEDYKTKGNVSTIAPSYCVTFDPKAAN